MQAQFNEALSTLPADYAQNAQFNSSLTFNNDLVRLNADKKRVLERNK